MDNSQLESGWAIRKLCLMGLSTIDHTMQLIQATENEDASVKFSEKEQLRLEKINKQHEENTEK